MENGMLQNQIREFEEKTGYKLTAENGRLICEGSMDLSDLDIEKLPDNSSFGFRIQAV